MPWNNTGPGPWGSPGGDTPGGAGGGGQRPGGPWGSGGGPGGRGPFRDFDDIIGRAQAWVRSVLPGNGGGGGAPRGGRFGGARGLVLLGAAIVALWLASGFYRVQPDEQGVVLQFGAFVRTTGPGLNYHIPWPIESVLRPAVTRINRTEIGYRSGAVERGTGTARDQRELLEESLMLTGDENIVDINVAVFWRVKDAGAYLFNIRSPQTVIKSVAESVMREVIARTPIQLALAERRAQIESDVHNGTQTILDQYRAGVEITQVQLQKVDPPAEVVDSFRDVQRAQTDLDRMGNEAESYRNDIIPRARGDAARITAEAEGARQASIAEATGQAQRFESVLKAYQAAKDVTLQRMYIDAMQDVITHSPVVVVDDNVKGLVPFLPLGDAGRAGSWQGATPPQSSPAPAPAPPASAAKPVTR